MADIHNPTTMETTALWELLGEVGRQLINLEQSISNSSPAGQHVEHGVVLLSHQDSEYAGLLKRLKLRISECLGLSQEAYLNELAKPLESTSWKVLAFSELAWFLDPGIMKQRSKRLQTIRKENRGKNGPVCNNIWNDPHLLEWAATEQSTLILLQGSFQALDAVEEAATDLIEYLEEQGEQVVWLLRSLPNEDGEHNIVHWSCKSILKQIAIQILMKEKPLCCLKTLALAVRNFKAASGEAESFKAFAAALQSAPSITYIVIDLGVLGAEYLQAENWPAAFQTLFDVLGPRICRLKVVLLSCHAFLTQQNLPIIRIAPVVAARAGLRNSSPQTVSGKRKKAPIHLDLVKRIKTTQELAPTPSPVPAPVPASDPVLKPTPQEIIPPPKAIIVPSISNTPPPNNPPKPKATFDTQDLGPNQISKVKIHSRDWFDEMKDFETCVDASRKEPDERHPQVKVAVLDTGADITHPDLRALYDEGQIKYHSFIDDTTSIEDLDGHGTHCTSLVAKFAPNAEIYVGRVFRKSVAEEKSPEVLAKAIEYATRVWEVDIISLSLGFTDDDEDLRDEIRKACANNIIIFAAAANNTINEVIPIRFPARMNEVICIFSSDSHGRPSQFNPPSRIGRANFTFPGENIEGAWPSTISTEGTFNHRGATRKKQDGTSCATPIAAAVAAGVLEFAWQERAHKIRRVKLLKHYSGMSDVILKRMVDQQKIGEYHYVKPWKLISVTRLKEEIPIYISDTLDHLDC